MERKGKLMGESISYGFLFEEAFSSSFADFTLKAFVMYTNHPSDNPKCHWMLIHGYFQKLPFSKNFLKQKKIILNKKCIVEYQTLLKV